MHTLSKAPANLLDLVVSEGGLEDLTNLSPAQKSNLFRKLGAVQMLVNATYKTKGQIRKAQARAMNVGESTISLWVKLYEKHGFRGLIDGRKAASGSRTMLPDVTKQWIKDQILNMQREDAVQEVHRTTIAQWNLWRRTGDPTKAIPGFLVPPRDAGKGEPAGFSIENFRKCKPTSYAKSLASQGTISAYRSLPSILSTCIGTRYLEYVFFDDEKPDVHVRVANPDKPVAVPLCFHALDRLTRYPFPPHIRLRWFDADSGTNKHLTRKEFVFYVINLLCTEGYRNDERGTCFVQEHGTAKVWSNKELRTPDGFHSFEDAMKSITARDGNPGARLDSSGIFNKAAFQELIYGPQASGNPRFKAPIESSFRLWRVYSQHLRGQTGRNIEMAPEETYGLTKYEEQIIRSASGLSDQFKTNLLSNFLTAPEFGISAELIRQALASRDDHKFEGWYESGFCELVWRWEQDPVGMWRSREELAQLAIDAPHLHEHALIQQRKNPALTHIIPWSPMIARESLRRDPQIRRLPISMVHLLIPTDWLKPATFNARNFIQVTEELLPGMDLQYLPELTTPSGRTEYLHKGDHILTLCNPLMPDTLLAYDQKHTFIGTLTRNVPLGRDSDQIEDLYKQRGRIQQAYAAPVRRASQEKAARRDAVRELNADLVSQAREVSPPAPTTREIKADAKRQASYGELADQAMANMSRETSAPTQNDGLDF